MAINELVFHGLGRDNRVVEIRATIRVAGIGGRNYLVGSLAACMTCAFMRCAKREVPTIPREGGATIKGCRAWLLSCCSCTCMQTDQLKRVMDAKQGVQNQAGGQ